MVLTFVWMLLLHPTAIWADTTSYQDVIWQYDVDITLQPDGQAEIVESIHYDFGLFSGHGIYRSIPARYVSGIFNRNIDLEFHSATDERGRAWPVKTVSPKEFKEPAGNIVWRIGDPDQSVEGEQTYTIAYTVDRALLYHDDYTEWYWNAIGTSWTMPIKQAHVTVHYPANNLVEQYPPTCYAGAYGETTTACTIERVDDATLVFTASLAAYQGMTIDLAMTPDSIARPNLEQRVWYFVTDNWSLGFIPLIGILFLIFTVLDRPARSRRPLIPIYEAPAQLSPATAELMMTGGQTARTLTAGLIELARTGYIHFVYDDKSKTVTELKKISTETIVDPIAVKIDQAIFGTKTSVILKQTVVNKTQLFTDIKGLTKDVALKQQWFTPSRLNWFYLGVGYATLMGAASGFMIVQGFSHYLYHWGVTGLATVMMIVVYTIRHRHYRPLSVAGADLTNELSGFRWFLRVTEAERVKFTSAPKLTPQLFEKFLPYAVVFGVEQEWIEQFKNILVDPPAWMEGNVTNLLLARAILSTAHVSADFKVPQTRSSTGGFGGGGFSGGGFGGGGGGRW